MMDSMDALRRMFEHQRMMQARSFGGDPFFLSLDKKIQYLKDMTLALEDELHEAMQEYGWKPWSSRRFVDDEKLKSELVDAWHFFMNLCIAVGMEPEELTEKYFEKAKINERRQAEGYDNTNKCPRCKRALDDLTGPCDCETQSAHGASAKRRPCHIKNPHVAHTYKRLRDSSQTTVVYFCPGVQNSVEQDPLKELTESTKRAVDSFMQRIAAAVQATDEAVRDFKDKSR